MSGISQDRQTAPMVTIESITTESKSSLYRSPERLAQSLFRLPSYWKLVPCFNKRPLGKKWQHNYYSPQLLFRSLSQEGRVWVKGRRGLYPAVPNGYSLLCGKYCNRYLVAIDCDSAEALLQFQAMDFPQTVSYSSGRPNRRQFLYYVDRPVKSFQLNSGLEVRGKNLLSTLPPSVHPLTGEYHWLIAPDCLEIPTISASWLNHLRSASQVPSLRSQPKPKARPNYGKIYHNQTIEELVYSIDPIYADIYDDWIRIGMALKDWDAGLLWLWDSWSQGSPKYKSGECSYKWSSFNGFGITYRTVYYYARIGQPYP